MIQTIAVAIITLAFSLVNPFGLHALSNKEQEKFKDLIDLLLNEGGRAEFYAGPLAEQLDLPDPAPTKNIDAISKWGTEAGRTEEEVTDNWFHSCSLLVEKTSTGELLPNKLLFQTRLESGRDSETSHFRTSLYGVLEKALVNHGKLDEERKPVPGSAANSSAILDVESSEVKSRLRHELDLWLYGKYFKPKFRKKHLEDLAYYRNKRDSLPANKKKTQRASAGKID